MTYAIIENGGKQYVATPGAKLRLEKLPESNGLVNFDKILFAANDKDIYIGKPYLEGALVTGERVLDGKAKKVLVFRYHNKTRYRKKKGHRQPFSDVLVKEIKIK